METPPRSDIEEEIARVTHEWRDHVDGTPLGAEPICNCYQYARAIAPLLNRVRAEAWSEGHAQAIANIAWPKERKTNPYREQNSEGNET